MKWFIIIGLLIIALVGCQGSPQDEAWSEEIARSYLEKSPTFKFDGIGGSIKLIKGIKTINLPI